MAEINKGIAKLSDSHQAAERENMTLHPAGSDCKYANERVNNVQQSAVVGILILAQLLLRSSSRFLLKENLFKINLSVDLNEFHLN